MCLCVVQFSQWALPGVQDGNDHEPGCGLQKAERAHHPGRGGGLFPICRALQSRGMVQLVDGAGKVFLQRETTGQAVWTVKHWVVSREAGGRGMNLKA